MLNILSLSSACQWVYWLFIRFLGLLACFFGFHGRYIRPWTSCKGIETCKRCGAVFIDVGGRQEVGLPYRRRRSVFHHRDLPPRQTYVQQRLVKIRPMTLKEAQAPFRSRFRKKRKTEYPFESEQTHKVYPSYYRLKHTTYPYYNNGKYWRLRGECAFFCMLLRGCLIIITSVGLYALPNISIATLIYLGVLPHLPDVVLVLIPTSLSAPFLITGLANNPYGELDMFARYRMHWSTKWQGD